jgi:hypothetical protein
MTLARESLDFFIRWVVRWPTRVYWFRTALQKSQISFFGNELTRRDPAHAFVEQKKEDFKRVPVGLCRCGAPFAVILINSMNSTASIISPRGAKILAWMSLAALALMVFNGKSYENSLKAIDSSIHSALALSATSDGIVPHLPIGMDSHKGHWGPSGFNDHPIFLFYLDGWVMRLFGPTAWSARLLPGLFSAGCVLLTAWLGMMGILAGAILALTVDFFRNGAAFQLDTTMTFFIVLSFCFWVKKRPVLTGVAAGMAVIAKAPVGLLIFPVMAIHWYFRGRYAGGIRFFFTSLAVTLGMLAVFWGAIGAIGGWPVVADYWGRQVFGSAVQGRHENGPWQPFLFIEALRTHYWPWLIFLVWGAFIAAKKDFRKIARNADLVFIAAVAASVEIVVISLLRFKSGTHYYVPAYPFLSLLVALPFRNAVEKNPERFAIGFTLFSMSLAVALAIFPIHFGPEAFPALKRFEPLIQSYGDCSQKVFFIEGQQPYGSWIDYKAEINFYTGRQMLYSECAEAKKYLDTESDIGWIIVSGTNLQDCISPEVQRRFKKRFEVGNQYLLTRLIPDSDTTDLTPLERELRAPIDCVAAPYPKDIYHAYE